MRYRAAALLSFLALVLVGSLFLSAPHAQTSPDETIVFSKDYKVGWIHLLLACDSFSHTETETATLRITRLRTDKDLRGGLLRVNSDWISGFRDFVRGDDEVFEQEVDLRGGSNNIFLYLRGDKNASLRIEVVTASEAPAPTATLTASPETITYGESLELSWTTEHADSVTIEPGLGAVDATGNATVTPTEDTTYTLTATGPGGEAQASVAVDVRSGVQPQPRGSFGEQYEDLIPPDAEIEAYDPDRFAIVTGFVNDLAGDPLPGVEVTVHDDERLYGTARTDETGRFAIPVEGGGLVTMNYHKDGYIDAHRQANVPWNDFAMPETVALIMEDTVATTVVPDGNPAHSTTHRSSVISDKDGARAATVVFPGDVKAYRVEDNGTETELSSFTVRVTEYPTPESMPAILPPTTAFTWCAEFTVDGAEHVRFDKPVVGWLDNFLDFPVGAIVPSGYYDRDRAVWVPTENGLVVELLDTDGDGIVDALDATGDGEPDDIDGDGVFADEVLGLEDSSVYAPGAVFWRVRMKHFTPYDWNPCAWPRETEETTLDPQIPEDCDDCEDRIASSVGQRHGVLKEDFSIAGDTIALKYTNSLSAGVIKHINIPITGEEVASDLMYIEVQISIAGRSFNYEYDPEGNKTLYFTWDGKDYRGDYVNNDTDIVIDYKYHKNKIYALMKYRGLGDDFFESFFGVNKSEVGSTALRSSYYQTTTKTITINNDGPEGFSPQGYGQGWTINSHHARYMSQGKWRIRKGDGTSIKAEDAFWEKTFAGTGEWGSGSLGADIEGQNATDISLQHIVNMDTDSEGSLYFASSHALLYVDREGLIHPLAGYNATWDEYGDMDFDDGTPAPDIPMPETVYVTVANNDDVYMSWPSIGGRIVKVDKSGHATKIAGSYGYGDICEDGEVAIDCTFNNLGALSVGNNGFIYVIDNFSQVRYITPDGKIHTLAGGGREVPDNVLATDANLDGIYQIYADPNGKIFVSDSSKTYVIQKAGYIHTVNTLTKEESYHIANDKAFDPSGISFVADGLTVIRQNPSDALSSGYGIDAEVYPDTNGLGYAFDDENRHVATLDLETGKILQRFEYDENDLLASIEDRFGNTVTIKRATDGNATAFVDSECHQTAISIDGNGNLASVSYPDGGVLNFEYDANHRMTKKTEPEGNSFVFEYDESGRIDRVKDDEGGEWTYERTFEDNNVVASRTTAEGQSITLVDHTNATGFYSTITDPAGGVTNYFRSDDGLQMEKSLPCGTHLDAEYSANPYSKAKMLTRSERTSPSGKSTVTEHSYKYTDKNNDWLPDTITQTTTVDGRISSRFIDLLNGKVTMTSPEGRTASSVYDTETLLTTSNSVPGLYDTTYQYDARGRVTGVASGNRTAAYTYDGQGNVATVTDAQNRTTSYTYDAMDRVTSVTRPDDTTVRFDWSKNGNLEVLTVPSNVDHGFAYNKVDKNTAYDPPLSPSYRYEYDRDRRLVRTVFPSGQAIENVYENGQLRRVRTPEGDVVMDYLCSSKIGTITMGTEFLDFEYDGPLVTSLQQAGELNALLTFGYDDTMRLESFGYAGGTAPFGYDLDGLLTSVGDFTIERDAANGLPLAVDDETARLERDFNGYGEVENQTLTVNGNAVGEVALTRDTVGRITAKTEIIDGVAYEYAYEYDDFGRLAVVRDGGGAELERYTYGPQGERLTESNVLRGIVSRSFTYDDEDRLLTAGSAGYTFDADGFLTSKTDGADATTYDYSSRGELKRVELPSGEVVEYRHDPLGRRVAKLVDGNVVDKYLWLGRTRLLAVYDGDGSLQWRFDYADGRMPVSGTRDGAKYYFAYDQVGSLRAVIDESGTVVKTIRYDSFGNIIEDSNPNMAVPFGFAGGLHDRDTGLVRFGYRDYDPDTGRWTAKDPIGFKGGDMNLFVYVLNNPIRWSDSFGLTLDAPLSPPENNPNWIRYPNRTGEEWFHCGYQCYLENRDCSNGKCVEDPIQEACYDEQDRLVDENSEYPGCRGTPNQYPQDDWYNHGYKDDGGVYENGWMGWMESNRHRQDNMPPIKGSMPEGKLLP